MLRYYYPVISMVVSCILGNKDRFKGVYGVVCDDLRNRVLEERQLSRNPTADGEIYPNITG